MLAELGLGLVIGLVMALTGAGGGILAVPLLVFARGLAVPEAAPIALVASGLAAALGAGLGLHTRIVRYKAALLMAGVGVLMAPAGVWLAQLLDDRWLHILFALVLLFVGWRSYVSATLARLSAIATSEPPCVVSDATGRFIWNRRCARALAGAGGIAGLLSGLLGVGGGFVMVPALQRYTDLHMQSVVATSLAVTALVSLSGITSNAVAGTLNWLVALPFALGALAGMLGGRVVASYVPAARLQQGFAVITALVAVAMMVDAFF